MSFAVLNPIIGTPVISYGQLPDSTSRIKSGTIVSAYERYWGGAEFIYAKAGGAIRQFGVCVSTPAVSGGVYVNTMTEAPNTANLGRSLFIATTVMNSGDYGWFQVTGLVPVNCTASITADTALGIVAAGQAGAIANGKQILNGRSIIAATATVAKTNCFANSGGTILSISGEDGWFAGAYLSGTGIASGTTVTSIDPSGTQVTLSLATTAQVTGTVTATYNNSTVYYNVVNIDRPFAQGQVT